MVDSGWAAAFALAAALNLNDPDAPFWLVIYLTGSMATLGHAAGHLTRRAAWLLGAMYAAWAVFLGLVGQGSSEPMPGLEQLVWFQDELVREVAGLGLLALWCGVMGAVPLGPRSDRQESRH